MKTRQLKKSVVAQDDIAAANVEENDDIEVVAYDDSNGRLESSLLRADNEDEQNQEPFPPSQDEIDSEPITQPESSESITALVNVVPGAIVVSSDTSGDPPAVLPRVLRSSRSADTRDLPQVVAQPLDRNERDVRRSLLKRPKIAEREMRSQKQAKKLRSNQYSSSSSSSSSSSGSIGSNRGLNATSSQQSASSIPNNSHSNMAAPRRVATPPIVSTQYRRPRNIFDKSIHGG